MPPRYPDVTGALIAGGRATRLGGAVKGLLEQGLRERKHIFW